MKVIVLSPYPQLTDAVVKAGDIPVPMDWDLTPDYLEDLAVEFPTSSPIGFIVLFGYRHILKGSLLNDFKGRIINIHISYLPWNRGADPNFWSFWDNTPKGVTIHQVDSGIDTGPILCQRKVEFGPDDTLATSYDKLQGAAKLLFEEAWPDIRDGKLTPKPQTGASSYHHSSESRFIFSILKNGYNTPISKIEKMSKTLREMAGHETPVNGID